MAIEKTVILNVETKGAVENIEEVDKSIDQVNDSTKDLTDSFDKMTGGLISGFKGAVGGIRKGVVAMKSLKVAIAATGVGLLVIAIGSLVTFFTKTERGGRQLEIVMAQLGAAIDVIIDRVSQLGEWFSNIFSQPFSDSVSDLTDTFAGMGDELEREIRLAGELKRATQELTDAEIDLITVNAQRRQDIAKDKLIAKDRTLGIEERIAALKRALALEDEILISERVIQAERFRIAAAEVGLGESLTEDRRRVQEEQAKLIDLTTASLTRQKEVQSELQALLQESLGDGEEGIDIEDLINPITGLTTTDLIDLTDEQFEIIKAGIGDIQKYTVDGVKQTADQTSTIERIERKEKQKRDLQSAQFALQIAGDLTFALGSLAKEGSEEQKRLRIAGAIIDTLAGGVAGMLAGLSVGGPWGIALGIATSAAVLASGYASVRKMSQEAATQPQAVQIDTTAPAQIQSPDFNIVGTAPENQLANTVANQQPIKAFVVASDVTTQQSMDRQIVETASFG